MYRRPVLSPRLHWFPVLWSHVLICCAHRIHLPPRHLRMHVIGTHCPHPIKERVAIRGVNSWTRSSIGFISTRRFNRTWLESYARILSCGTQGSFPITERVAVGVSTNWMRRGFPWVSGTGSNNRSYLRVFKEFNVSAEGCFCYFIGAPTAETRPAGPTGPVRSGSSGRLSCPRVSAQSAACPFLSPCPRLTASCRLRYVKHKRRWTWPLLDLTFAD